MTHPGRGSHDVGGLSTEPIERREHAHALWEKRVDALLVVLSGRDHRLIRVDELRRGIEQLGAEAYDTLSYYERWIASITNVLIEKGVISVGELARKMEEIEMRCRDAPGQGSGEAGEHPKGESPS